MAVEAFFTQPPRMNSTLVPGSYQILTLVVTKSESNHKQFIFVARALEQLLRELTTCFSHPITCLKLKLAAKFFALKIYRSHSKKTIFPFTFT